MNEAVTREARLLRTAMLLSAEQLDALAHSHVMLFGLGGVGSYTAEALARVGVGKLTLVDNDTVSVSNLNRQLPALASTVGRPKTEVVAERLRDIAPDLELHTVNAFYLPESPVPIPEDCSAVADAIDTVSAKLHIIETCHTRGIPLVSCMGMGNRLDPSRITVGDIFDTSGCPLCRVMRRELRKRGIPDLRCVYSTEEARTALFDCGCMGEERKTVTGSVSFVPSVAGLYLAWQITLALIGEQP